MICERLFNMPGFTKNMDGCCAITDKSIGKLMYSECVCAYCKVYIDLHLYTRYGTQLINNYYNACDSSVEIILLRKY